MTTTTPHPPATCPACGTDTRPGSRFCGGCGATLTAATSTELVPVPAAPPAVAKGRGRWEWTRRRVLIAGVCVLAVAAGVGLFLTRQSTGDRAADGPVRAFYDALAAGDAPAATAVIKGAASGGPLAIDQGWDISSPLWTDPAALSTGYQPPTDVVYDISHGVAEGREQRPNMSEATVVARYTLDGHQVTDRWIVERETEGLERAWSVVNVRFAGVRLTSWADTYEVQVAGVRVAGGVEHMPPGIYDVALTDHPLFEDFATQLVIGNFDGVSAGPELSLRESVVTDVRGQVDRLITRCLDEAPPIDLDACPIDFGNPVDAKHAAHDREWEVVAEPEYEVKLWEDSGAVTVELVAAGQIRAEYRNAVKQRQTVRADIVPSGPVTVDPHTGRPVWTYQPK